VAGVGRLSEGSNRVQRSGLPQSVHRRARPKRILQSPAPYNKMAAHAVSRPAPSRTVALRGGGSADSVLEVRALNLPPPRHRRYTRTWISVRAVRGVSRSGP
jgi:hypothetical protein